MANLSRTELIGNIGKSRPTLEYTAQGVAISKCTLATTNRDGKTEWHRLFAEGRTAEIMGNPEGFYTPGKEIHVDGQNVTIRVPAKKGPNGQTIAAQTSTWIKGFFVQLTGNAPMTAAVGGMDMSADALTGDSVEEPEVPATVEKDEDIPF